MSLIMSMIYRLRFHFTEKNTFLSFETGSFPIVEPVRMNVHLSLVRHVKNIIIVLYLYLFFLVNSCRLTFLTAELLQACVGPNISYISFDKYRILMSMT